jgi:hypothetical protein
MMRDFLKEDPSQPSPQGGGLNPVVPLLLNQGEAVPLVLSPPVGERTGRPEGVFRRVIRP